MALHLGLPSPQLPPVTVLITVPLKSQVKGHAIILEFLTVEFKGLSVMLKRIKGLMVKQNAMTASISKKNACKRNNG